MSDNIITTMVFGGRKFNNWKEENPRGIYDAFKTSQGSSTEIERILNDATGNECRKQVKDFIEESEKIGLLGLIDTK